VRLAELQDEVASLTRARDLSEWAYKAGAIPLTDVLDADRQLLISRNDVESTRSDAARASVRTFRASPRSASATKVGSRLCLQSA
jgi:outer membrane protein TolC